MSFDFGSSTLRLAFCWPSSIGAGNSEVDLSIGLWQVRSLVLRLGFGSSKVIHFDWSLAKAKSCPSIGVWQGQGSVLRLGDGTSELYPSTGSSRQ